MPFKATPEQYEQARQMYLEAAQSQLGDGVVAAALFRRGGFGASFAASKAGGGLAYAAVALGRKKKAGGLPDKVLLALTPTKLHAYKVKFRGRGVKLGDEVAVWDRAALRVGTQKSMNMTQLTIESPAEGERVTLVGGGIEDDPISQDVMRMLAESAAGPVES